MTTKAITKKNNLKKKALKTEEPKKIEKVVLTKEERFEKLVKDVAKVIDGYDKPARLLGLKPELLENAGIDPDMVDSRVIALAEAYLRGKDKSIKERLQKLQPKVEPAKFEDEKPKAEKPKKEIKPVSEKPKRATDSTKEVDRFGNGVNTQVAKINACLNGKPRTAQHIADELNCKVNSVRAHMQTLMGRGFVERVGDGYQVVTESK